LQRLLDGVPERWRDAEAAWWPASAKEMWGTEGPAKFGDGTVILVPRDPPSTGTGAAAHVAAPGDTAIKISRRYGKSPCRGRQGEQHSDPSQALNVGDHNIIRPLKAANAQQKGRPVIERRSTTLP
jgi:hypothetical protein